MTRRRQGPFPALAILIAVIGLGLAVLPAAAADKVIVVRAGDTLSELALEQGVSVAQLVALNGIRDPSLIYVGQRLRIRADAPPAAVRPRVHRVVAGENLTGIASRYGTTIAAIVAANSIRNPSYLRVGQNLIIPGVHGSRAPSATAAPTALLHVVAPGENLTLIAGRYGTTIAAIVAANSISNPSYLRLGQHLAIPAAAGTVELRSFGGASLPGAMAAAVARRQAVGALLVAEARAAGVDPTFAMAVAWQESGWRQGAVSSSGAIGVMQLMPATAEWIASTILAESSNVHDTRWNIHAGVRLLRHYLDRYHGDRSRALAAYYQGERAADVRGIYPMTQPYIASILALQALFSR
ncbi:MAG TPA: LysM peptidoglycan-binding domain-containing protein [Candidatus Saccharimonadales bacterium]|nr:LysM peptidoglycan-binding domain-containing protein [Candidatus Saccharimonadales bacterium]